MYLPPMLQKDKIKAIKKSNQIKIQFKTQHILKKLQWIRSNLENMFYLRKSIKLRHHFNQNISTKELIDRILWFL